MAVFGVVVFGNRHIGSCASTTGFSHSNTERFGVCRAVLCHFEVSGFAVTSAFRITAWVQRFRLNSGLGFDFWGLGIN